MKNFAFKLAFVLLFSALGFISAHAETVTLTPVADTDIEQFSPDSNFGGNSSAVSGGLGASANHEIRRMLLRFDLSGKIPAGAIINSATLSVQVVRVPQSPQASTFGLHRLLENWSESGATWNARSPGVSWQTPGATGANDSSGATSSTVFISNLGNYIFPSSAALVSDVQSWAENPSGNFGWLLTSADEASLRTARHFATRESGADAPVLTIDYSVPSLAILEQPQSQTVSEGTSVQFSVTASGSPPIHYQWQFNGSDIPNETNATLILNNATPADSGNYSVVVSDSSGKIVSDPAVLSVQPVVFPLPEIAFVEPTNNARFPANGPVNVVVDAGVSNATISRVEFLLGTNRVAIKTAAPFSLVLTNIAPGNYQLSAIATSSTGTSNTAVVSFSIAKPLSVQIVQPATGGKFPLGTNIFLQASVPADSPAASRVDFFADGDFIGESIAPDFTLNWMPTQARDYILNATALDEFGETATSAPVVVRIFVPESERPKIHLTRSPRNFAHLTRPTVSLSGTASDNVGLDRVEVRDNNGSFQPADGTDSWNAEITLAAGLNTIQMRSVDLAGNVSRTLTRFFTFVQKWPLAVEINGDGTVFPDLNNRPLRIGRPYKIRAIPGSGQIFDGWIGTQSDATIVTNIAQSAAILNFVMRSNLTLTATFIPNPFTPARGHFSGLFFDTNAPAPESTGTFALQVSTRGAFSGRIILARKRYPFHGRFDPTGNARIVILRPGNRPIAGSLNLNLTNGADKVFGSITDGNWTAELQANRNVFDPKTNPAPETGRVDFQFLSAADPTREEATGFAKISASGHVMFAGALADGRKFSFATSLGSNSSAPFFVLSRTGDEMLAGWIDFLPTISGRIDWVLAAANGFSVQLNVAPRETSP
ncbi:MAG TPA: Ig-like domain-containing protein [Verrucomicrobiae bacterium]|nr:Ig-like domain-containing protein [Verrucomicrobiae bacterium]